MVASWHGHRFGGLCSSKSYGSAPASAFAAPAAAPAVTPQELRVAVAQGTSEGTSQWKPAWQIGDRQFHGVMKEADRRAKRH